MPILLFTILLVIFPERTFEAKYTAVNTVDYTVEKFVVYDSLKVDVTWYTSSIRETDSTPFITASGSRVRNGIIAVSHDLLNRFEYGDSLYVKNMGWFEVQDCMHHRWTNTIDIWCGSYEHAIQNGRQTKWIFWNFREKTASLLML